MGFVGVYRAIFDYAPQASGELSIAEGDLLFVLEKSAHDDWWKAKKKAANGEEEEPEGLIPNNYIEEAPVKGNARSLYEYQRQTDEELSFKEGVQLEIFDVTDSEWTLVGLHGEYGFVPSNYIEAGDADDDAPPMPARSQTGSQVAAQEYPSPVSSPVQSPAAALAGLIQQKTGPSSSRVNELGFAPQYTPEASDEEPPPPMPARPQSQQMLATPIQQGYDAPGVRPSPDPDHAPSAAGGYHLYNINEMISHLGKNKKMPTTLGINIAKGTIFVAPEKSRDGGQKEWTAEKLTNYSIEGKHVFMELVKPSRSIDFHAGAKDTAQEIVASLGELAGNARGGGLREVIEASAGGGQKKGVMLYEFMAQGDDEVTVAVGDEVIILDDTQSDEWMMVRRRKNGNEGVVPSSYVEVTGAVAAATIPDQVPASAATQSTSKSRREQRELNRIEEERLAREALKSTSNDQEVGPGLSLPDRHSSLGQRENDTKRNPQKTRRGSRADSKSSGSKPDQSRVRTWTDRSGTFKVEAQFLGLKDGKINLHKNNGVKIAVAANKMSIEDIEFVERATGQSLDDDKPLSEIRRRNTAKKNEIATSAPASSGAVIEAPKQPEYDWFDFFLACGVNHGICERYAGAFARDQMGEESLQDINPTLLRTLGVKEGDVLRIMKYMDNKFNRSRSVSGSAAGEDGLNGDTGIFSGPGGALRNNTRKGRPAPAVSSNDTVDPRAFEQNSLKRDLPDPTPTPLRSAPPPELEQKLVKGFDDDAWDVKPSTQQPQQRAVSTPASTPAPAQMTAPTGALSELSLLSPPLQPAAAPVPSIQKPQATGADPSFFDRITQPAQTSQPRARPQVQQPQPQNLMLPPPPQRPLSAPLNLQNSAFAPPALRPQMTGNQSQIAPPGQSLAELNQQRMMSQMYQNQAGLMYAQQTGFQPMQQQPMGLQPTGFSTQQQFMNGQAIGSPFADPPRQPFQAQPTGFGQIQPQPTGINSFLSPALQPQRTDINGFGQQPTNGFPQPHNLQFTSNFGGQNGFGLQSQRTGFTGQLQSQQTGFAGQMQPQQTGFGGSYVSQQPPPPMPPMPQQQQIPAPLVPQKTGPAPPIRFGVTNSAANKLVAQPTGRRANLAAATPQNPFGF